MSVHGLAAVAVGVGEVTSTKYVGQVYTNNTKTIPKFSANFHSSYFPYVNTIIYLSTFGLFLQCCTLFARFIMIDVILAYQFKEH